MCRCADDIAFRRHVINADSEFIAAAVFDVNKDGKLDIACGGYWYEAPTWKKHFLRNVEMVRGRPDGYAHQVLDVNGDGWPDLVTVNWRTSSLKWIEHPGANLAGKEWQAHVIALPGPCETGRVLDLLGDGTPVLLPCGVNFAAWWELRRKPDPEWIRHELPRELAGHGLGTGDINGDGRMDLVGRNGWAEAPQDRRKGRWIWHPDFDLGAASIPILVVDVDGDGLNDIVWTRAHDYGIYWLQQRRTRDGRIRWIKHAIDHTVAGAHAPLWVDLDGDGREELVVGRRYLAHEGRDPGEFDPLSAYRYQFDPKTRTWRRWLISYNDGVGFGVDPVAVDLTGSGRRDLVCGGRNGLYWLENLGKGNSIGQGLTQDPLWFPRYHDHSKLLLLEDRAGKETPIRTPLAWGQRRAHILAAVQKVLGVLPDSHQRVPLDYKVLREIAGEGYVRKKITYGSDLHSRASAWLLVPEKAQHGAPAVLCLHDDHPLGKDDALALGGPALPYAHELARRGYVCLVPEHPSFRENAHDFAAHARTYASGAMKAIWDNIRGIDLLETLPEVDCKRIAILGHGLGGRTALFTAAFDGRIAAVVSNCGFTEFTSYKKGNLSDWASPREIPRIRELYHNDPALIPFSFAELLATLAPRPVLISAPVEDKIMEVEGVKHAVHGARAVYDLRRAASALRLVHPAGGHEFTAAAREAAYTWLNQQLRWRATSP
jgi:dienelactone hydrolase